MLNAETVGAAIRQVREKKGISQEVSAVSLESEEPT